VFCLPTGCQPYFVRQVCASFAIWVLSVLGRLKTPNRLELRQNDRVKATFPQLLRLWQVSCGFVV